MIRELAKKLDTDTASITLGTNFFCGFMEEDAPDTALLLSESGTPVENDWQGTYYPRIQFFARSRDYFTAENLAKLGCDYFFGKYDITLPVVVTGQQFKVTGVKVVNQCQYLGRDSNKRHMFSSNLELVVDKL